MYYIVRTRGGKGNAILYVMDMKNGKKEMITEVASQCNPGIYWRENGMIVADSVEHPQYIQYTTGEE